MSRLQETIAKIDNLDLGLMQEAQARLDNLTKPQGSLGKLEELAKLIVGITKKPNPGFKDKVIFTLAADHGVVEEGISAFPQEVTRQMVYNFINRGAGINVLANHIGAKVIVVDMGIASKLQITNYKLQNFKDKKVAYGTKNMVKRAAMSREEAIEAIETGIGVFEEEFEKGIDIIGTGDMGIGNTTSSSAISSVITGASVEEITGRGTGLDDKAYIKKIEIIKKSLEINKPDSNDPIDVLLKVGGFEIAGLCGIILAAGSRRIPVVIDGFISSAAALIAYELEPKTKNYMIAAHISQEQGHKITLNHIGLKPLLDLGLRLGEGTGAALGIGLVEASIKILTEMATFKGASVSEKNNR